MIKTFIDTEQLNLFAAEKCLALAIEAINQHERFTVALAGGSTPKSLYQLLTTEKFKNQIDWTKVYFFFGDERNVLPGNTESNFRMAYENLLKPLEISGENIFRWKTEMLDAEKIAEDYEQTIKEFFNLAENKFPRFDLILLGMGADGHTASLFPFTKALNETEKIAVANPVEKLNTTRLTLTFSAINRASNIIFLINGAEKAEALKEILEGKRQPDEYPSQNVKPKNGNLFWLLDEKAAQFLK